MFLIIKTELGIGVPMLYVTPNITIKNTNIKYEPIAFIIFDAGHYKIKVKTSDGTWILCNDSKMLQLLDENEIPINHLVNSNYCILYKQIILDTEPVDEIIQDTETIQNCAHTPMSTTATDICIYTENDLNMSTLFISIIKIDSHIINSQHTNYINTQRQRLRLRNRH